MASDIKLPELGENVEEGEVVDVNRRQKSLMETFRAANRNGSDLDPKTMVRIIR